MRATTDSFAEAARPQPVPGQQCPHCAGPVALHSPHVLVRGARVRVFCSDGCLVGWLAPSLPEVEDETRVAKPPSFVGRLLIAGLAITGLSPRGEAPPLRMLEQPAAGDRILEALAEVPAGEVAIDERAAERERARAVIAKAARDPWVHPLPAPRRMPLRDSRVFGADRPGDRPAECRSGHCGVDLGQRWGEPVLAAHAGVVDRVRRVDRGNGGIYVRLAHRDGTVFTQYFHLAAVPAWVVRGARVQLGDVIGMVGDTGVGNSGPHLHFTIAVRPTPHSPMTFIDPEPLIALWPVVDPSSLEIAESAQPGVPLGAAGRKRRAR